MKRRTFVATTLAAGINGLMSVSCNNKRFFEKDSLNAEQLLPETLAAMSLKELRDDYRHRLFERYLPFWDKGGYDDELGGVIVNLNDDGTTADDEKFIWFQGRGLWVYSFLYNNFGQNPRYLERARKMRDFIVKYLYAGNGRWYQRVNRDGSIKEGVIDDANGWGFIAEGLQEYYKADGNKKDIELAEETIWAMVNAYENPNYNGVKNLGGLPDNMPTKGLRDMGHSRRFVRIISQILDYTKNQKLENLLNEHLKLIMTRFYNPEFGIFNEYLQRDYSRIPGNNDYTFVGHTTESLWIIMFEALRTKNKNLFTEAKNLVRKHLELGWDYIYEGLGTHYYVFDGIGKTREKLYGLKEGWAQFELMTSLMLIIEYTGENWAKEWYERQYKYVIKTFDTDNGVWRQAVNRKGQNANQDSKLRKRWNPKRKGNFHQPRCMMYNLLCLDRMIKNKGKLTPFPI